MTIDTGVCGGTRACGDECVVSGLRVGLAIGRGGGADVLGPRFCSEVLAIRRVICSWLRSDFVLWRKAVVEVWMLDLASSR
jgi:hypothetical protein